MSLFCHQVRYTTDNWNHLVRNSNDRFAAVRAPIEKLGGNIQAIFFVSGPFDVLAIAEFPDTVTAALIAAAFGDGGAVATIQTFPLQKFPEPAGSSRSLASSTVLTSSR